MSIPVWGEIPGVRCASVVLGPSCGDECDDERAHELAGLGGELLAQLRDGLADPPMDPSHLLQRVRCAENLRAILRERGIHRGGMLAVDGGHVVGM